MDQVKITNPQGDDPDVEITVKGRCLKCWGRLIQHGGSDATLPRLKCRVCGRTLEGSVAKQELDRVMKEVIVNLFRMDLGAVSSYEEGVFAYKAALREFVGLWSGWLVVGFMLGGVLGRRSFGGL